MVVNVDSFSSAVSTLDHSPIQGCGWEARSYPVVIRGNRQDTPWIVHHRANTD